MAESVNPMLTKEQYQKYIQVLQEELVPAMGCTEPIAIAYAGAIARDTLRALPDRVELQVSGNILKNAKSVAIPNMEGMKGVKAAAAAGIVAGRPGCGLEVLAGMTDRQRKEVAEFLAHTPIQVSDPGDGLIFEIRITVYHGEESAMVCITHSHTHIEQIAHNGRILMSDQRKDRSNPEEDSRAFMNIQDIVTFADTVELEAVKPLLDRQIACNMAVAEEGMTGSYGASIGKTVLEDGPADWKLEACAYAAAGSDARMGGCTLPVVILSGSGNQGITASVPVICCARRLGASEEKLYRALLVSDLTTVEQKRGIGRLSAYCGAVSAGCGAGAGIAYLFGGGYDAVAHTLVNAVAVLSGTVCDGAKPSCAAKIFSSVRAGILGFQMYTRKKEFVHGEGIVLKGVDNTIRNVGCLASRGMRETDEEIIRMMLQSS